jgi:hypothetical protein
VALAAPAPHRNRRRWIVAGAIGAAAALSIGVFAATRDEGHTAVPPTTTTTPATTAPSRSGTSGTTAPPSTGRGSQGSGSTGRGSTGSGSTDPSTGSEPSTGSGGGDQGSSLFPDNGDGSVQLPDGSELPDLGQLPSINGQSLDDLIREILRRLGIDPDTVLPPSGQQGGPHGDGATTNGTSGGNS